MDRDNEIELIQTIQEKDRRIKELEAMSSNIGRELLVRTDELNEVLEKQKNSVSKDKIREKIKELEKEKKICTKRTDIFVAAELDIQIESLKELLEEGK